MATLQGTDKNEIHSDVGDHRSHFTALWAGERGWGVSVKILRKSRMEMKGDSPTIFTASFGLLLAPVGTFSIFRNVSIPSITFPNTTCFPSRKSHFAVVMKN